METKNNEIYHHGILFQKWHVRRYQNPDGSLTPEGRKRYLKGDGSLTTRGKIALKRVKSEKKKLDNKYKKSDEDRRFNNAAYKQLTGKNFNRRGDGKNSRDLASEKNLKEMSDKELQQYYNRLNSERNILKAKRENRSMKNQEEKDEAYDKMSKGQRFIKKTINESILPGAKKGLKEGVSNGVRNVVTNLITSYGGQKLSKAMKKELKKDVQKDIKNAKEDVKKDFTKERYEEHLNKTYNVSAQDVNYNFLINLGKQQTDSSFKKYENIPEADIIEYRKTGEEVIKRGLLTNNTKRNKKGKR